MKDSDIHKGRWVKANVTIKTQGTPYLLRGTLVKITSNLINGNRFTAVTDSGRTYTLSPNQVDKI